MNSSPLNFYDMWQLISLKVALQCWFSYYPTEETVDLKYSGHLTKNLCFEYYQIHLYKCIAQKPAL